MKKIRLLIISVAILVGCTHQLVKKENYSPLEIRDDCLIVNSIDGETIKITESAKDSVIHILKETNMLNSDSLWCIVEYEDEYVLKEEETYGMPDSVKQRYKKDGMYHFPPEYLLWFRNSELDREKAYKLFTTYKDKLRFDHIIGYIGTQILWDKLVKVNEEKTQVTKVEY